MTATTNPHSVSETRRSIELQLADQLYAEITSGHDGLAFHVGPGGPTLVLRDPDAKDPADRFRVLQVLGSGEGAPRWARAKELLRAGLERVERDRRFNPYVLVKHLRGNYAVALIAPGWVSWVCLDVDAHQRAGESELVARQRANRVLGAVWRALGCSATRHPLIERTPRGYHVWLPLTRGDASANAEHTWPAQVARRWVEWHLRQAGLEFGAGDIEVFPTGSCLRAPCGRGCVLLQATDPDNPDGLGLTPWPGTAELRFDAWLGTDEPARWARRVVPTVRAFLEQWGAQRRTLADWLGRPEAAWDPRWAFLGWRGEAGPDIPRWREIFAGEKNSEPIPGGEQGRSQQSDDGEGCPQAANPPPQKRREGGAGRSSGGPRSGSLIKDIHSPPAAGQVDSSPDPAGGKLVRGRAFSEKVTRLLADGLTQPGVRHDAVLTLAFYWAGMHGRSIDETLVLLGDWCRAHSHEGSTTMVNESPRSFVRQCLQEARHYVEHYAGRWRFRGGGHVQCLVTLTPADRAVVAAVAPCVAGEVETLLAWLAGRADATGRVLDPVQISHGLLTRLCGERRIDVAGDGRRHRATTVALTELERIGVLTLARQYCVGKRGRIWSCWYRFGSGELARPAAVSAATWEERAPFRHASLVPTPALLEIVPQDAPSAPMVAVMVVGERAMPAGDDMPPGLLRVLSDGARGLPRTLYTAPPGLERPTAEPAARAPWFDRQFGLLPMTPQLLWAAHADRVVDERRHLSRGDRLDLGGGGRDRARGAGAPVASVAPSAPHAASAAGAPDAAGVRELVAGANGSPNGGGTVVPLVSPPARRETASGASSPIAVPALLEAIAAPAAVQPEIGATAGSAAACPSSVDDDTAAGVALTAGAAPDDGTTAPRSESALRAELADDLGAAFTAECDLDVLETLCGTWSSFLGRGRGRGS
jgi:hypothetical protein